MNIGSQITLNISVLVFGLLFTLPFSHKLNPPLHISLAWFSGWGVIVFSEIVLVMTRIHISLITITSLSILLLGALWIAYTKLLGNSSLFRHISLALVKFEYTALIFISVTAIFLLVNSANYMKYTPDSRIYEAMISMFHKLRIYADTHAIAFERLLDGVAPFYIAVHNIAHLCGIQVYYSFMGATTFFTGMALWGFWKMEKDQAGFRTILWFLLVIILFFVNRLVVFHSFYLLTNLTTMAYYTLGVLSLYRYFKSDNDAFWFIIACFFFGCTGILRKEMLIFSVLPFAYAGWKNCIPKLRIALLGLTIILSCSYLWFFWRIFGLSSISEVIKNGLKTTGHGGLLIVLLCCIVSVIIFIYPLHTLRKMSKTLLISLVVSVIVFAIYWSDRLMGSISDLNTLIFKNEGAWSSFWVLVTLGLLVYFFLRLFSSSINNDKSMEFLAYVIVVFLIARTLLFAIFEDIMSCGFNYSGNRTLLHLYPVALYFLGRIGFRCMRKWDNERIKI